MKKKIWLIVIAVFVALGIIGGVFGNDKGKNADYQAEKIADTDNISDVKTDIEETESKTDIEETESKTAEDKPSESEETKEIIPEIKPVDFSLSSVEKYNGSAYISINDNHPYFTKNDIVSSSFEKYSDLDTLGRCGVAVACIGKDIMPTEERGSIGQVKPTGWQMAKYDFVDGKYLYNRCHLIGYQLSGENANDKNLITGTRYLNVNGMLPFENMVADYVKETNNHVMYRVSPVFDGNDLVASGVLMEAYSVEDSGEGVEFCVFCYNVQPGVVIDYSTGENYAEESKAETTPAPQTVTKTEEVETVNAVTTYILNTNTKKFHYPDCGSVKTMKDKNKEESHLSRDELISQGYSPCGNCNP